MQEDPEEGLLKFLNATHSLSSLCPGQLLFTSIMPKMPTFTPSHGNGHLALILYVHLFFIFVTGFHVPQCV